MGGDCETGGNPRRQGWLVAMVKTGYHRMLFVGFGISLVKLSYFCGVGKDRVRLVCLVFTFSVLCLGTFEIMELGFITLAV